MSAASTVVLYPKLHVILTPITADGIYKILMKRKISSPVLKFFFYKYNYEIVSIASSSALLP